MEIICYLRRSLRHCKMTHNGVITWNCDYYFASRCRPISSSVRKLALKTNSVTTTNILRFMRSDRCTFRLLVMIQSFIVYYSKSSNVTLHSPVIYSDNFDSSNVCVAWENILFWDAKHFFQFQSLCLFRDAANLLVLRFFFSPRLGKMCKLNKWDSPTCRQSLRRFIAA